MSVQDNPNLPVVQNTYTLVPVEKNSEQESGAPALPITHYLWAVWKQRLWIGLFLVASAVVTLFVSLRLTPMYEATAVIEIDRRVPTGVIGRDSEAVVSDGEQFLNAQIRLLQSDSVLRPVAEQFNLLDTTAPSSSSRVSPSEGPVRLKDLKINRVTGASMLLVNYRATDPRIAAELANAIATSYIEYTYKLRITSATTLSTFMERQLGELKAKMERSTDALQTFERGMSVINPEQKTSLASARLEELNAQLTQAQSDRLRKEASLNAVKSGSLEALQVSSQGDAPKRLAERFDEATERFNQARLQLGTKHPEYQRLAAELTSAQDALDRARATGLRRIQSEFAEAQNRERLLLEAVNNAKREADHLNQNSFEYQNLRQEADTDKKLYEELVRKIKEAGINSGFQNNAIRLADPARPIDKQIYPDVQRNVILATLLALALAVGASLLRDLADSSIRDPELVKTSLRTEVIGTLPLVSNWRGRRRLSGGGGANPRNATELIRFGETGNRAIAVYDEAIRTMRNSVLLSNTVGAKGSLMFTSAMPAEGKTTTSTHFAIAHAQQGYKTLLIDCDLRRPGVHRALGLDQGQGLSEVILTGLDWHTPIVSLQDIPNLFILPAGAPSRTAADGVGKIIADLITNAAREYDFIVVDAPPLLGFSEPLRIATVVDGVVLVALAGQTDRKAVSAAVETLRRLKANLIGLVLNEITRELSSVYSYYGYYGKYYRYYGTPQGNGGPQK